MSKTKRFCECEKCGCVLLEMLTETKGKCKIIDDNTMKITYTCPECKTKNHKIFKKVKES